MIFTDGHRKVTTAPDRDKNIDQLVLPAVNLKGFDGNPRIIYIPPVRAHEEQIIVHEWLEQHPLQCDLSVAILVSLFLRCDKS